MIEVSATAAPALALPGAVLSAAPAVAGGEGAQIADFSAFLTGSVLAIEAPAMIPAQPEPAPAPTKLTPAPAAPTGKIGVAGKPGGKILPDGKVPVAKELAASDTAASEAPTVDVAESDGAAVDIVAPLQSTSIAALEAPVAQPTSLAMASQEQRTTPTLPAKNPASTPKGSRSNTILPTQAARAGSASPGALRSAPAEAATTPPIQLANTAPEARVAALPADPAPAQPRVAVPGNGAVPSRTASSAPVSTALRVPQAAAASVSRAATGAQQAATSAAQPAMNVSEAARSVPQSATIVLQPGSIIPQTPTIVPQAAPITGLVVAAPIAEQTASTAAIATVLSAPGLAPAKSVRLATQVAPDQAQPSEPTPAMPQEPAAKLADSFTPRTAGDLPLMRVVAAVPGQPLPVEHKSAEPSLTPAAIAAVTSEATVQPARSDIGALVSPEQRAAPAVPTVTTTPPAMPAQDVAALVDRITEARAAAAPQSIRAALVHEDFGAISLNLHAEDSHIHVTLGSADPTFAPAVHAAAAASLAANADEPSREGARRDAHNQQQQQDTSGSSNAALPQQASNQQASRDRAAPGERSQSREQSVNHHGGKGDERRPSTPASARRSGIYA